MVGLALTLLVAGVTWSEVNRSNGNGLAGEATITVSSTAPGSSPHALADTGSTSTAGAEWSSDAETEGAWFELAWTQPRLLRSIVLVNSASASEQVRAGYLTFSDGSSLQTQLSSAGVVSAVGFTPRRVTSVRFTVSTLAHGASQASLAEIIVSTERTDADVTTDEGGNAAALAAAGASASVGSAASLLNDGALSGADPGWFGPAETGTWVELVWDVPRELTSVQLFGNKAASGSIVTGRLEFGDGGSLVVGGVVNDPAFPTTVGFMPRVSDRVRFVVTAVTGGPTVGLTEIAAYRLGATATRPPLAGTPLDPSAEASSCIPPAAPAHGVVTAYCPTATSRVGSSTTVKFAAPGMTAVRGRVVGGEPGPVPPPAEQEVRTDGNGLGSMTFALDSLAAGPFTVELTGRGSAAKGPTYLQLYREGGGHPLDDRPSSALAAGKTLVFAEEFAAPVSVTRTGAGAQYAASKPTANGVEDFGDAVFPDPALGFDNLAVLDQQYLRIGVEPLPNGYQDPNGWRRRHLGGLLSSARAGGSGFSAQYGYFEARMLLPAGEGTWPAFWLLPAANAAQEQARVAEIDILESYGHNPVATCHSTHAYADNKDNPTIKCGTRFENVDVALRWHTYGVRVSPTDISYYIDDKLVVTLPQVEGGGDSMFFMVDLALGGGWPVELDDVGNRVAAYVDYVRVYA